MGIKIKNLQTGEFEKFNIPALKGEKGEPGEIEPSEKVDYIGKQHSKLRDAMNANVDYIIKTAIGEFNYLDYEGQHITATNSIEGHAKNAILSGHTLVNLINYNDIRQGEVQTWDDGWMKFSTNGQPQHFVSFGPSIPIDRNKEYYMVVYVQKNTANVSLNMNVYGAYAKFAFREVSIEGVGVLKTKLEHNNITNTEANHIVTFGVPSSEVLGEVVFRAVILEYQEGMENWDIPYFTGMQSVKMPVLRTVGKNLFDIDKDTNHCWQGITEFVDGRIKVTSTHNGGVTFHKTYNIPVKKGRTYHVNVNREGNGHWYLWKNGDTTKSLNNPFTVDDTFDSVAIGLYCTIGEGNVCYFKPQIEEGSVATTYEPYKTNILHTPEEVVLRSLPNGVCDTFNTRTGVYTQRIGEVVLDGSHSTRTVDSTVNSELYQPYIISGLSNVKSIKETAITVNCDKLITRSARATSYPAFTDNSIAQYVDSSADFVGVLLKSTLGNLTPQQWFENNPVRVQYQLETPVVKTVDLSDNHVYSYKDVTHYDCSSAEGSLVPTLSVKVPTDTQLTIQEQKATTQTLLIKNMDLQQSIKEVQAMNLAFNTALYNSFNSIREEVEDIKKHVSTNENLEGSF